MLQKNEESSMALSVECALKTQYLHILLIYNGCLTIFSSGSSSLDCVELDSLSRQVDPRSSSAYYLTTRLEQSKSSLGLKSFFRFFHCFVSQRCARHSSETKSEIPLHATLVCFCLSSPLSLHCFVSDRFFISF